jgi:hypothetical protein
LRAVGDQDTSKRPSRIFDLSSCVVPTACRYRADFAARNCDTSPTVARSLTTILLRQSSDRKPTTIGHGRTRPTRTQLTLTIAGGVQEPSRTRLLGQCARR